MTDSERLKLVLGYLKLSAARLSRELGYEKASIIYNVLNGYNGISSELAKKITDKYREINFDWLISESGEMVEANSLEPPVHYGNGQKGGNDITIKVISDLTDTIKRLEKEIDDLKKQLMQQ